MADERELKIVIRAHDEFSSVMEQARRGMDAASSGIRESLDGVTTAEGIARLREYETGLKAIIDAEGELRARREEKSARRELERLSAGSPYADSGRHDGIYLEYAAKLDALREYNTAVIDEMIRAGYSQAQVEAGYTELSNSYARKRRDFQIAAAGQTAGAVSNFLQNLAVATDGSQRSLFETMKGFAIAETVIQTYRAAQSAYAALAPIPIVGPALATAAAAAAVAAGLARVKVISQTRPGGATGTIDAGGAATPPYQGGSTTAYPVPQRLEGAERRAEQNVTVNIYNPLSEQNWDKLVEDNIVPAINNAAERNIRINVNVVD